MLVKATKRGFCGKQVREAGEVFEFEGKLGSWMEAVGVKAPAAPVLEAEAPKAEAPAPVKRRAKAVQAEESIV
jgi:hypothetical protein